VMLMLVKNTNSDWCLLTRTRSKCRSGSVCVVIIDPPSDQLPVGLILLGHCTGVTEVIKTTKIIHFSLKSLISCINIRYIIVIVIVIAMALLVNFTQRSYG